MDRRKALSRRARGAGTTEWLLIVVLVGIALLLGVTVFGNKLARLFQANAQVLDGGGSTGAGMAQELTGGDPKGTAVPALADASTAASGGGSATSSGPGSSGASNAADAGGAAPAQAPPSVAATTPFTKPGEPLMVDDGDGPLFQKKPFSILPTKSKQPAGGAFFGVAVGDGGSDDSEGSTSAPPGLAVLKRGEDSPEVEGEEKLLTKGEKATPPDGKKNEAKPQKYNVKSEDKIAIYGSNQNESGTFQKLTPEEVAKKKEAAQKKPDELAEFSVEIAKSKPVTLAGGSETLYESSSEGDGIKQETKVEAHAKIVAGASAEFGPDGLKVQAGVSAKAGVSANHTTEVDLVEFEVAGQKFKIVGEAGASAFVGVEGKAGGEGSIGKDGAGGKVGASAFAGAKGDITLGQSVQWFDPEQGKWVTVGSVKAVGSAYAGAAAKAELSVSLKKDKLQIEGELGASLGAGAGAKVQIEINADASVKVVAALGDAALVEVDAKSAHAQQGLTGFTGGATAALEEHQAKNDALLAALNEVTHTNQETLASANDAIQALPPGSLTPEEEEALQDAIGAHFGQNFQSLADAQEALDEALAASAQAVTEDEHQTSFPSQAAAKEAAQKANAAADQAKQAAKAEQAQAVKEKIEEALGTQYPSADAALAEAKKHPDLASQLQLEEKYTTSFDSPEQAEAFHQEELDKAKLEQLENKHYPQKFPSLQAALDWDQKVEDTKAEDIALAEHISGKKFKNHSEAIEWVNQANQALEQEQKDLAAKQKKDAEVPVSLGVNDEGQIVYVPDPVHGKPQEYWDQLGKTPLSAPKDVLEKLNQEAQANAAAIEAANQWYEQKLEDFAKQEAAQKQQVLDQAKKAALDGQLGVKTKNLAEAQKLLAEKKKLEESLGMKTNSLQEARDYLAYKQAIDDQFGFQSATLEDAAGKLADEGTEEMLQEIQKTLSK